MLAALDDDSLTRIFNFCDAEDVENLTRVCRALRSFVCRRRQRLPRRLARLTLRLVDEGEKQSQNRKIECKVKIVERKTARFVCKVGDAR